MPPASMCPRVLILTEIPTPYRLPLYRLLAATGELDLTITFLAETEPDRPWDLEEELRGIPHRFLPGYAPALRTRRNTFVYEVNPGILRLLRESEWDMLVIGGYAVFAEQAAIAWARATGTPYMLHSETHLGKPRRGIVRAVKRAALPMVVGGAAAGLATGSAAARYLAAYGLPPGRIRIVPNTIDVTAYGRAAAETRAHADETRRSLDLPRSFVLYVGRLVEAKGLLDLADALERLGADAPTVLLAGEGPLRDRLRECGHMRLLGFQDSDRLKQLYALADAVVLPSRDEPWGVVVNEALACGTPMIVSSAVGAAEDLVRDGDNGRVVPPGDASALAAALAAPPARAANGRIARWTYEFAVDQFLEATRIALRSR